MYKKIPTKYHKRNNINILNVIYELSIEEMISIYQSQQHIIIAQSKLHKLASPTI